MPVLAVHLTADAYAVCMTHALSTEKEEIMGLLIGEFDEKWICHISAVILLHRSDKQEDRVEISPEQLSAASSHAENLGRLMQRPMRVVGWYHSHPHITVWPSHIDLRTQAMYQMMDEGFIGLIFSVFNQDKNSKVNSVQVSCWQSKEIFGGNSERVEVPLHIKPVTHLSAPCVESLVQLPLILCQEEEESYNKTKQADLDLVSMIHNEAVYTKSMGHIFSRLMGPLTQTLEQRLTHNKVMLKLLDQEEQRLQTELKEAQQQQKEKALRGSRHGTPV